MPISGNPFAFAIDQNRLEAEGPFGPPPPGTPGAPDDRVRAVSAVKTMGEMEGYQAMLPSLPQFMSSGEVGNRFRELQATMGSYFPEVPPVTTTQQLALFGMAIQNPKGAMDLIRERSRRQAEARRQRAEMDLRLLGLARDQVNAENDIAAKEFDAQAKLATLRTDRANQESMDAMRAAQINLANAQTAEASSRIEERQMSQARLGAFMGDRFTGGPTLDEYGNPVSAEPGMTFDRTLGGAAIDAGPQLELETMRIGESGALQPTFKRGTTVQELAQELLLRSAGSITPLTPDQAIQQARMLLEGARKPTLGSAGGPRLDFESFQTGPESEAVEIPGMGSGRFTPLR